ncbi:FtsX-like permease family protein [Roseomonas sp. F4]
MRLVIRLAIADALHDRLLFACAALTVAAVLLPLLLLLSLKTGLVERMIADLRADPGAVELRLRGNGALSPAWFEAMRARPDVAFVVPRVRTFGSAIQYARADDPLRARQADIMASGRGDPLLGATAALVTEGQVVVSRRVAEEARLRPGDELLLWRPIPPRAGAAARRVEQRLRVAAIAPAGASDQRHVFGTASLAGLLEDLGEREGATDIPAQRTFASFRLYARDVADVAGLQRHLESQGMEVDSDAGRIAFAFRIDRNLTLLFLVLVGCASLGVAGALAAALWSNVVRKRRSLSLLRLMGMPAARLALFPLVQAGLVVLAGCALAAGATAGGAAIINALFAEAQGVPTLARVVAWHLAAATLGALLLGLLAGGLAVRPVLRIAPSEGLRDG